MSSNDKVDNDSSCLVARAAAPCALSAPVEPKLLEKKVEKVNDTDSLVKNFTKLSVNSTSTTVKKPIKVSDPTDFLTLQSLRSSALARKTNTTSKFGRDGANLFADLLATDEEEKPVQPVSDKKSEKKSEEKEETPKKEIKSDETPKAEKPEIKEEKENKDEKKEGDESELLSRGPVRVARSNVAYHPYGGNNSYPASNESFDQACAAFGHQPGMYEYGHYNAHREGISSSSTPDTVSSDLGYSSSSTSPHQQLCASNSSYCGANTVLPGKDDAELPDALSDFILKYSRSYRGAQHEHADETNSGLMSPKSGRPPSVESNLCDSPLSAGIAPESSPGAPFGGITGPSTPSSDYRSNNKMGPLKSQLPSGQYIAYLGRQNGGQSPEQHARPAKEVLRKLIQTEEMDDAWAWLSKMQACFKGALCHQDSDMDTLVHICVSHMDLGKIYALVEQMIKTDYPGHKKPFDMRNRNNETPLFLAIEKRNNSVVDYLLEAGADPNTQNSKIDRDSPLHLASRLGMAEIVKTICSYNSTNLNANNGKGLTPLLCAVIHHGVYEEEGGYIVDNTQTIRYLLKFGADPLASDATNGKTAMHYAITRMAPEIIDVFKDNLDEELMSVLVNKPDNNNETALSQIQSLTNTDESIRFKLCMSLIVCGSDNSGTPSP